MDAVILAAGLGTRLRPHTLTTPKPLLAVRGRPLLDWTLGALPPAIDRVVVVVNYLAEQIEAYLQQQTHIGEWTTVRQAEPRGTGDALRACQAQLRSERFLVMNGDDLYGAADLAALAACPPACWFTPWTTRAIGHRFLKPDGTLEKLVEKPPLEGRRLANTGVYLFPREVFDIPLALSARGEYEITDYVTKLAERQPVSVVPARFWLPIGHVEAWQQAQQVDLAAVMAGR